MTHNCDTENWSYTERQKAGFCNLQQCVLRWSPKRRAAFSSSSSCLSNDKENPFTYTYRLMNNSIHYNWNPSNDVITHKNNQSMWVCLLGFISSETFKRCTDASLLSKRLQTLYFDPCCFPYISHQVSWLCWINRQCSWGRVGQGRRVRYMQGCH